METAMQAKRRAILIFTLDRSGVLNKIAMLIRRKMHNVDTITVFPQGNGHSANSGLLRRAGRDGIDIVHLSADQHGNFVKDT